MSNPLGSYDPDFPGGSVGPRPQARTELQRQAFVSCGRKYWKDTRERKRFENQEAKARSSTFDAHLHKMWIVHNISLVQQANVEARATVRSMAVLLAMLENEAREVDWKAANRDKVAKERGSDVIDSFTKAASMATQKKNGDVDG